MTSREHLVPTLTVDKNGRTTTVHKKRVAGGVAKNIPLSNSAEMIVRRNNLIHVLASGMESRWAGGSVGALAKTLKKYPDILLERLSQAQVTNGDGFVRVLRIAITKAAKLETVSEYVCFLDDLDASSYYAARDHIASLHQYTQLPESDDFSNESEELKSQCRALLKVQRACAEVEDLEVFRMESGYFVIDDDDLVELILGHPDRATQIADSIRERKTIDVALIAEVITSDATALGSGTL
jgi:hypothetical protein